MYKNIALIISLVLLGISPQLFAQTTYKVTYKVDPVLQGSLEGKSKNTKQLVKKIIDYAKKTNYILITNQEKSFFEKEELMTKGDENTYDKIFKEGAKRFTPFHKKLYSDHQNAKIIFIKDLAGQEIVVKRDFHDFKWQIQNDTETILGFSAQKAKGQFHEAITNKTYEIVAWFIPSIPSQSGPDIFMGLPGLIVELHLPKAVIKAENIEKNQKLEIEKPNAKKAITQKEYKNLISRLNKKLIKGS